MTLDARARRAVQALEAETAVADPAAALERVLRRQRRGSRLQVGVAVALVLVMLAGALLLRAGAARQEQPVAPPSTGATPSTTRVPGTSGVPSTSGAPATTGAGTAGGFPIPPGPPFPRAAATAFPPLFNTAEVRRLRQASQHPVAFPTWLPARLRWTLSSTQVLGALTDYRLQPAGGALEIEVFHSQVDDGRSTDPLDAPVPGLTMPNRLKVYAYKDMTSAGTDAYIISDRREYVVVYFFNCERDPPGRPGRCLTQQERFRLIRGLAMVDSGR